MDYSGKIITKNPVEPSQTSAPGVWTLDQATQAVQGNNWPIAYVPNPISRSLRFNSADSAYLNRTFSTPTSNTTWTFSCWLKRGDVSVSGRGIFAESTGYAGIYFPSGDTLRVMDNVGGVAIQTTAVYRDPSAWAHLVVRSNGTNIKAYWNSVEVGSYNGTITLLNAATSHHLGRYSSSYFNGYMTEVNFIDGQALDPTYFGMTDPRTGAWIPKKYSGTYGTNGFYLNFSDNSTTAALGTDYSGNSNTWTTNNFSVTAGSGNDSMTDVPTPWIPYNTTGDVGGVVRGNYATRNPLAASTTATGYPTNGNLDSVWSSGGSFENAATMGFDATDATGYYWEYLVNGTALSRYPLVGVANSDAVVAFTGKSGGSAQPGSTSGGWMFENASGNKFNSGSATSYGTTTTSGWGCVAVKNGKIFIGSISGGTITWKNSGNPITEANPMFSGITGTVFPTTSEYSSGTVSYNFGQQAFQATPPAGFKSLCTTNLPEPTILDGGDYFNTVLYTGNGSTQTVSGVGFQPDLVWIKNRQTTNAHKLVDAVRGAGISLSSNSTDAEGNESLYFTNFTSDGFDLALGGGGYNAAYNYVAWNWKANGAGSSNTAGTITSTVSANQTAGFSIVTYTGNGVDNSTIGHGLGAVPSMIILKKRNDADGWPVYHKSLTAGYELFLNTTAAQADDVNNATWGDNYPSGITSSVFEVGYAGDSNNNGDTYVAYCFAPVEGYSAFGSYTGNGSADGPFVYTGFRPRYLMVKVYDSAGNSWWIWDSARNPYNETNILLAANASSADTSPYGCDFLSNGFKLRTTTGQLNGSGLNILYAAFAENPFKYSNAR